MAGRNIFLIYVTVIALILYPGVVLSESAENDEADTYDEVAVLNAKDCRTRKHNVQDCSCLRTMFKDTGCTEILDSQFIKSKFNGAEPKVCNKHFRYCYGVSEGIIELSEKQWNSQCCRSLLCYIKVRRCV